MNYTNLISLAAGIALATAAAASHAASADDERFSLSSAFDDGTGQYEAGPWAFKLTVPSGLAASSELSGIKARAVASDTRSAFADTEAAASYNLYSGSNSRPEVNLTGKIKVNLADKNSAFGLSQNDYAAQMDVYQNMDKFTAKGSLGSKLLGSPTGITLSPLLYGSFGGMYRFTERTSTGVDMNLSQEHATTGTLQQELSAYVDYKLDKNFKARGFVLREYSNGNLNNFLGGQVYYGF